MAIFSRRVGRILVLTVLLLVAALLLFRRCEYPMDGVLWDSDDHAFPPVGDQCETWSCVPWAAAYALAGHYAWRDDPRRDQKLPEFQFSPSWVYNVFVRGDCHSTMDPGTIFCRMRTQGAASMAKMPFGCDVSALPTPEACEDARVHKTGDFHGLPNFEHLLWQSPASDWTQVRNALRNEGPLFVLANDFTRFSSRAMYGKGLVEATDLEVGTSLFHAMVCVGFDDGLSMTNGTRGAFRLRNSWGTCWGEGGSVWVSYADAAKLFSQVWSMHGGPQGWPTKEDCPSPQGDCTGTALATAPTSVSGDRCRCECGQSCAPAQKFEVTLGDRILVYGPRIPVVPSLSGAEDVAPDPQAIDGILKPDGPPEVDGTVIGARRVGFPYRVIKVPASPLELTVRVLRPPPAEAKGDRSRQRTYAEGRVTILAR